LTVRKIEWGKPPTSTKRITVPELPPHVGIDEAAGILEVPRHVIDQLLQVGRIPVLYAGGTRPQETEPVFYTRREAAELLRISESTLDKAIKDGIIPVLRIGERGIRISAKALADLAASGTIVPNDLDEE